MKAFSHTNAKTLAEASTALPGGKAEIIASGTDLIGRLKDNILSTYPARLKEASELRLKGCRGGVAAPAATSFLPFGSALRGGFRTPGE